MSSLSDEIDAVTSTLTTITTQFPPAVAAAIAAAGGVDTAAVASAGNLKAAADGLVTALQGSLPAGNVTL